MKKALSRVESHLVGRHQNIARVLASVSRSPRRSAFKNAQASGMSARSVWLILLSNLNLHPYKLPIVHSWSDRDKEVRLQFCHLFR